MAKSMGVLFLLVCMLAVTKPQDQRESTRVQPKTKTTDKRRQPSQPNVSVNSPKDRIQDKRSFAGFFKIAIEGDNGPHIMYVLLRRNLDTVELTELGTGDKLTGKIIQDPFSEVVAFRFEIVKAGRTIEATLALTRSLRDGSMRAFLETPEKSNVKLTVQASASVWACNNHSGPRHTTDSEDGMREMTDKYGCKGWHPLEES